MALRDCYAVAGLSDFTRCLWAFVTDELTGVWLFVNDERLRLLVTNELMGGVALRDLCCCSS